MSRGALILVTSLLLASCATKLPETRTEQLVAVERACAAYESVLERLTLRREEGELNDDVIKAINAMNTQVDAWCLPSARVPTNTHSVIARLSEMTAQLSFFLLERKE